MLKLLNKFKNLKNDKQGIFWVTVVGTISIIVATMTWLIVIIATQQFVNIFGSQSTNPITIQLGDSAIIQGSIVIAVIDIGLLVWMVVSAFITERQESPVELM